MIKVDKCSEYGKDAELTGADREDQEISMLALHLLQSALVLVNTRLVDRVLEEPGWAARMDTPANRRALSPLFWSNVGLHGRFELDLTTRLDYYLGPRPPDASTPPNGPIDDAGRAGLGHLTMTEPTSGKR